MQTLSLLRRGHPLAEPRRQVEVLENGPAVPFSRTLEDHGWAALRARGIEVLQVNVGKVCNQTCTHCHVDAGPDRRESMSRDTFVACLEVVEKHGIPTVDITGGAPELNPHFRWFVVEVRRLGRKVLDRCNLTVLLTPHQEDLPGFLAAQQVEVIASLPCYLEENTDRQRGEGVYAKSIEALRRLNAAGYGQPGSALQLTLVFNPGGPSLPPDQETLEAAYRKELFERHGVVFHRLIALANMPISRFLDDLVATGRYEAYMGKLAAAFNLQAVAGLMCRTTVSVGWDGRLYDCDFNQMLELATGPGFPRHIREFSAALAERPIAIGQHCYGCTAGAGSGCGGAIVGQPAS